MKIETIKGFRVIKASSGMKIKLSDGTLVDMVVLANSIDESNISELYEEVEEVIEEDQDENTEPSEETELIIAIVKDMAATQVLSISNEDALKVKHIFPLWSEMIGKEVKKDQKLQYDDKLYNVVKKHTVLGHYPPSIDTASLYSEVNVDDAGTLDNPIPYSGNMQLEKDKYYSQYGITYLCIESVMSYWPLSSIPRYVKAVEK